MTRWRRLAVGLLIAAAIPVLLGLFLYGGAWYYRWRATQVLAAIRQVKPGVTTQAEYDALIKRFLPHAGKMYIEDEKGEHMIPGALAIGNHSEWVGNAISPLSRFLPDIADNWIQDGPIFAVYPEFKDGKLSKITIQEMQGSGHPAGGFVTIYGGQATNLGSHFKGYSLQTLTLNPPGPVWSSNVDLDDRATLEERRKALDFSFECFTVLHACEDGTRFLRPAPKRASQDAY